ncbi:MAG: BlaI/MecI/CopY family transcriptional regulator [Planctomycetota bacterium]
MARPPSQEPTDVELKILRILWRDGPSPVRAVHERLQHNKTTNYSTTVKMLSVMLRKALITRDDQARPQVYRAVVSQKATQRHMLSRLIENVYEGSAKSLVLHALASRRADAADRAEIRRLLDELGRGKT